jgi:hypothetical protein
LSSTVENSYGIALTCRHSRTLCKNLTGPGSTGTRPQLLTNYLFMQLILWLVGLPLVVGAANLLGY